MINRNALTGAAAAMLLGAPAAIAAQLLVETIPGADFDVSGTPVVRTVTGTTDQPVSGVGFTALWTAVVADTENGQAPWSVDLGVVVTAPNGTDSVDWEPIGGEISIADYPLQDFTPGFLDVSGQGDFEWSFTSVGSPWVAGLRNVEYHLLTEVPDVEEVREGSVADGPTWNRPFSIVGISSQGPVIYDVIEFTVPESGGYTFLSVLQTLDDNFTFLYRGGFDPENPLDNLLDYGLGNGFGDKGTPRGTSLISALLFEDETYYYVTSQFDRFAPGRDFVTNITGPAAIIEAGACPADLDGDGQVGSSDLSILLGNWGTADAASDLDASGAVGSADLSILLGSWGPCSG